ncbi:prostamide/prostaglandin F synthase [Hemiscyllium ocellatum]|uniref:prostamide/prostaglandin F synthase n=1 Tax=Hemiscyllium ocellatum TaxID=170820 RepID=UPI0029665594|nr:prostamide/prostaglandin F synthase [Hemiscyllium ocellatum]
MPGVDVIGKTSIHHPFLAVTRRFDVEMRFLWHEVILFLRRFACQVCLWTAKGISKLHEVFVQNNMHLTGVRPEELGTKDFIKRQYLKGCDLLQAIKGGISGNSPSAMMRSGGMLIVMPGGEKVLFNFVQVSLGDHVPLNTILQILDTSVQVDLKEEKVP